MTLVQQPIVKDQGSHEWRHFHGGKTHSMFCTRVEIVFGRRHRLTASCKHDNFTGTACISARGVLVFHKKKRYAPEPIHGESMSRKWREAPWAYSWLMTIFISQEISIKDIVELGWGLSLNDTAVYSIYGTLFFSAPQNRATFRCTPLFLA